MHLLERIDIDEMLCRGSSCLWDIFPYTNFGLVRETTNINTKYIIYTFTKVLFSLKYWLLKRTVFIECFCCEVSIFRTTGPATQILTTKGSGIECAAHLLLTNKVHILQSCNNRDFIRTAKHDRFIWLCQLAQQRSNQSMIGISILKSGGCNTNLLLRDSFCFIKFTICCTTLNGEGRDNNFLNNIRITLNNLLKSQAGKTQTTRRLLSSEVAHLRTIFKVNGELVFNFLCFSNLKAQDWQQSKDFRNLRLQDGRRLTLCSSCNS